MLQIHARKPKKNDNSHSKKSQSVQPIQFFIFWPSWYFFFIFLFLFKRCVVRTISAVVVCERGAYRAHLENTVKMCKNKLSVRMHRLLNVIFASLWSVEMNMKCNSAMDIKEITIVRPTKTTKTTTKRQRRNTMRFWFKISCMCRTTVFYFFYFCVSSYFRKISQTTNSKCTNAKHTSNDKQYNLECLHRN